MLNIEETKKIQELRNLCKELKVMSPPDIIIDLTVQDMDKNITYQNKQRAHSFTRNFWNNCFYKSTGSNYTTDNFGPGYISIKNKNNSFSGPTSSNFFAYNASLNSFYGILIGISDAAFDINSYTSSFYPISSLVHQAMTHSNSYNETTKEWIFVLSRVFVNNSGVTRLIKETGLTNQSDYLMERTVLDNTIEMVDSAMLTVNYSISMDFSAIDS